MPSLHVGWAVWCAFAIVCTSQAPWRHLAWLYPTATTLVVIATANHYVLDAVAGAALAAICVALTRIDSAAPKTRADGQDPYGSEESIGIYKWLEEMPERQESLQPAW